MVSVFPDTNNCALNHTYTAFHKKDPDGISGFRKNRSNNGTFFYNHDKASNCCQIKKLREDDKWVLP
jgi:hypothetical protein